MAAAFPGITKFPGGGLSEQNLQIFNIKINELSIRAWLIEIS